jgi:N-methylhydantoinase A
MQLDPDCARDAITRLASQLELSPIQAALGIIRVAESNMSRAIAQVTSRRGIDPRLLALMPFGGAGGLHACAIAESLAMRAVIVPPMAGVLSALGMIVSQSCADAAVTVAHRSDSLTDSAIAHTFDQLTVHARSQMPPEQEWRRELLADVRFSGQSHELTVSVTRATADAIGDAFVDAYTREYSNVPSRREVQIVNLRVRVTSPEPGVQLPKIGRSRDPMQRARVVDDLGNTVNCVVAERSHLVDAEVSGPMLMVDEAATTWVPASWRAAGRDDGTVILSKGEK